MEAAQLDWSQVLIVGVPAYIAALGAAIAAIIAAFNNRNMKTPSGDKIGKVTERTHDLAAIGVAAATGQDGPTLTTSVRRLAADPEAPIHFDRRKESVPLPPEADRRHDDPGANG